ncbi:MAG: flagellar basal-body MS-ring/collar protein FliF [Cypionkella sp.]|nr:flagellar basal-body MS-ring/collar protein FliF [Cypionkella sp.]
MQNLIQIWQAMDMRRRMVVAGATLAVFVAILGLSRMAAAPNMTLLYAGLSSASAGEVVAALDAQGAIYEVRGDSIYVDGAVRDNLRMTLASEGLPAAGGAGYEILDGLSGFGTTSQMFDAAYWRAKEGELARTILANPQIKSARVHIAQAPSQPFQRNVKPSASVTITSITGAIAPLQARALRHLVAAAVPSMLPNDVAVIDAVSGLIPSEGDQIAPSAMGDTRAAELRANVERLLSARVGPGKAVVEVNVDVVTESEQISERKVDPQGRVAISTETNSSTGSESAAGSDVTVASNLPEGQDGAGGNGKSETSEQRERVNYEISETTRDVIKAPGSIKKISVAVLVDGSQTVGADGTVTNTPRPDEELAVLRELVASAVGLDEARGDVLTLKSLEFQPLPEAGALATASMFAGFNMMTLIQTLVLGLVALVLGLFVIRPMLAGRFAPARAEALPAPDSGGLALPGVAGGDVLTGEIDSFGDLPMVNLDNFDRTGNGADASADPVARLRRLIEERQAESVEILRGWMETEEEKA